MEAMRRVKYLHNRRLEWVVSYGSEIQFYFGDGEPDHRSDILCLGRYIGTKLYFYEQKRFNFSQSLIGEAPWPTTRQFEYIIATLKMCTYEKPILVSSKINKYLDGDKNERLSMELAFDDGFCFRFGDLPGGNLVEFVSFHPPGWYLTKNFNRRAILKNPKAELWSWLDISVLGLPPGSAPRMDYLKNEAGIDDEFLATNGLTDMFNELVVKMRMRPIQVNDQRSQRQSVPAVEFDEPKAKSKKSRDSSPVRQSKSPQPSSQTDKKECCVCFEEFDSCLTLVPCGHTPFCSRCVNQLEKCPVCRVPITQSITIFQAL